MGGIIFFSVVAAHDQFMNQGDFIRAHLLQLHSYSSRLDRLLSFLLRVVFLRLRLV